MMKGILTFSHKKNIYFVLICLLILCFFMHFDAYGARVIDTNADVSLKIQYKHKSREISGASFELYRVADILESGTFTLTGEFEKYPVTVDGLNTSQWYTLAETLAGYVKRDDLEYLDSGKTNSDGILIFPKKQEKLKPGLYLVIGKQRELSNYIYDASPFLISLPDRMDDQNGWKYDVSVSPKYDWDYEDDDGEYGYSTVTRKVLKVWNDNGYENIRPKEIVVQLLRDGDVYDTVTLNAANNWRYTWSELKRKYDWSVVEKEVDGYFAGVSQEGITFVVTNTYKENVPDNPGGFTPEKDFPGGDSGKDTPDELLNIEDDLVPQGNLQFPNSIPKTGQLWWPVPVLAGAGMLLILLGLLRRRGAGYEK